MTRHHIYLDDNDPQGYGDGLSDIVACTCGERFSEKQYGGYEEAAEHLEALIPGNSDHEEGTNVPS